MQKNSIELDLAVKIILFMIKDVAVYLAKREETTETTMIEVVMNADYKEMILIPASEGLEKETLKLIKRK